MKLSVSVNKVRPSIVLHEGFETVSDFIRAHGTWHRPVAMYLLAALRDGDVFVDVGVNLGYFSVYAAMCVGEGGVVHAIEPDDEIVKLLRET